MHVQVAGKVVKLRRAFDEIGVLALADKTISLAEEIIDAVD